MILKINIYDSFTHNLAQYIGEFKSTVNTIRNDKISIKNIVSINPCHTFLSPGPGNPNNFCLSLEVLTNYTH